MYDCEAVIEQFKNKKIADIKYRKKYDENPGEYSTDSLIFTFSDGKKMRVFDGGQNCCESRYMKIDDDLTDYITGQFLGIEVKSADVADDDDEGSGNCHEVQFVDINTSRGTFTIVNHNEHNGYYGGFGLAAEEI